MVSPTFSFGGIASGLDTGSIVEQLLALERQPIRRFEEQKQQLRRVDDSWSKIVGKLSSMRAALDEVRRPGALSALTTATSSDPDAVVVTSGTGGRPGATSFTVTALADSHRVAFGGRYSSPAAVVGAGEITLTDSTGGPLATIATDGTESLTRIASRIRDLGIGVEAQVVKVSDTEHQLVLSSTRTGASSRFEVASTVAELGAQTTVSTGTDAQLQVGSMAITRSSNRIDDLVAGAVIELKKTTSSAVSVSVAQDDSAVVTKLRKLVTTANDLLSQLATEMKFDPESKVAGVLQGDPLARDIAFNVRQAFSQSVAGGTLTHGSQIGLSLNRDGRITLDDAKLKTALRNDPSALEQFVAASLTGDEGIALGFASRRATDKQLSAVVQQAGSAATATSGVFSQESGSRTFSLTTPAGRQLSVTLDEGSDAAGAAARIRAALTAAGDTSMTVDTAEVTGGTGLRFAAVGAGSARSFTVDGYGTDLDGTFAGTDVVVDFGEGSVTGKGYSVTGSGPADGLTLTVTGGVGSYAVRFGSGLSGVISRQLERLEGASGRVQQRRDSISGAVRGIDRQMAAFDIRVGLREATLRAQFTGLETSLARLQSQGRWLSGAMGGLLAR